MTNFLIEAFQVFIISNAFAILMILNFAIHGDVAYLLINKVTKQNLNLNFAIKTYIGSIVVVMILFTIGVARILYPNIVLSYFFGLFGLHFLFRKYWKYFNFAWLKILKKELNNNKWSYLGLASFYLFSTILFLRPIMTFDGLWYHLPIPRFFLQEGNIDYLGVHLRYSVHPYLNFFWNLLPLSLPVTPVIAGIIINVFQQYFLIVSFWYLNQKSSQIFSWNGIVKFIASFSLLIHQAILFSIGGGYNDLYGTGFGIISTIYILTLSKKEKINSVEVATSLLLIIGLFLLKIFFGIFAFILFIYACTNLYSKFLNDKTLLKRFSTFFSIGLVLFAIFVLPWIVRSYYFTGRLLDPIGTPGFNEDAYNFAGSISASNHWGNFIWVRFRESLIPIFTHLYSPLMLLGLISPLFKNIREKYLDLWFLGICGFFGVFFISIVAEWRYFLPAVSIIIILGLCVINEIWSKPKLIFSKLAITFLPLSMILFLIFANFIGKTEYYNNTYLIKRNKLDSLVGSNLVGDFNYYLSENSPKPTNYTKDDLLFIGNIHNMGYIPNPIIEPRTLFKNFQNLNNAKDFFQEIKNRKVKFILIKRSTFANLCKMIEVKDHQSCDTEKNKYITEVIHDDVQQATWFKMK
jgi:hypothetical protein